MEPVALMGGKNQAVDCYTLQINLISRCPFSKNAQNRKP